MVAWMKKGCARSQVSLLNLLPHDRVARADKLLHCLLSDLAAQLLQLLEEIRAHAHLIRRILAQHLREKKEEIKRKEQQSQAHSNSL